MHAPRTETYPLFWGESEGSPPKQGREEKDVVDPSQL
jgi:hypothetical protein